MRKTPWNPEGNRCLRLFIAILVMTPATGCSKRTPAHPGASIVVYNSDGSIHMTGGIMPQVHDVDGIAHITLTMNSYSFRAGESGEKFSCTLKWDHLSTLGQTDRFRFEITTGALPGTTVEKFVELRDEPVELTSGGGYRVMLELEEPDLALDEDLSPSKPAAESPP